MYIATTTTSTTTRPATAAITTANTAVATYVQKYQDQGQANLGIPGIFECDRVLCFSVCNPVLFFGCTNTANCTAARLMCSFPHNAA